MKVLALYGRANIGKTQTIKKLFDSIISKFATAKIEFELLKDDVRAVLTINGKKIGIESQGDPGGRLIDSLGIFIKVDCEIIICATRTRGSTVEAVKKINTFYEVEWIKKTCSEFSGSFEVENCAVSDKLLNKVEALIGQN